MAYSALNYTYTKDFIKQEEIEDLEEVTNRLHHMLHEGTGKGNEFLGWIDLPNNYDRDEFNRIKQAAKRIRSQAEVLLVIGIGGSYIGARAAIEMLTHSFHNLLETNQRNTPQVLFIGHHLSATYISELFDILENKDFAINVISKSGTTTEPAIAFRVLRSYLIERYGKKEARKRIYVTTDKDKGALKTLATAECYETFIIPNDIGGRYSVLTAVGLLPIAVSGISINEMMEGAFVARNELLEPSILHNQAYQYAGIRNLLYQKGKTIEILINYEPKFNAFSEWWKQLFAESEGKNQQGIFPTSAHFTTDLHSIGQYIQDGRRDLFQTTIQIKKDKENMYINKDEKNIDGLNYLTDKSLHEINKKAYEGTILAHTDGKVPNIALELPEVNAFSFGYIVYFFEKACAMSGYLLDVNPFNQPGVEAYKRNMFALLGKEGFEKEQHQLEERMKIL